MSEKPYKSKKLDEIRGRIDALDHRIHDALMERAELVLQIGEEKRRNNIQIVQPAREARMIRRLLERHKGALPEMAVVRIWRELVGAVSLLQTGLKVAVSVPANQHEYWDMARDYFGSCLPMQSMNAPLNAIGAVRDNKATFAVVPWPEIEEENPWWAFLADGGKEPLRISIRLPHGDEPGQTGSEKQALVVAKIGFDDSGADRSFLLIECGHDVSRGRIVDNANKAKLKARSLHSRRTAGAGPGLHLLEVEDFVAIDDPRLKEFASFFEDGTMRCTPCGGYPVPPCYKKTVVQTVPETSAPEKASA